MGVAKPCQVSPTHFQTGVDVPRVPRHIKPGSTNNMAIVLLNIVGERTEFPLGCELGIVQAQALA